MNKIIHRDAHTTVFQSTLFQTNSTVILTEDVVMVIDPVWLPEEVLHIRNYVESIRNGKPIFLFFTHSDYDHLFGYKAFDAEKVFITEAFAQNPKQQAIVEEMQQWDADYYIQRPYPIEYPKGDFIIYRDGVQFRYGKTRIAFYLTPGHTADSMMLIVWQLGICIAGDYLSDIEFPFIYHSSSAYIDTMEKLTYMHDRNWFTRVIPGHGNVAHSMQEWQNRRIESLEYIYHLRESIALNLPFDEKTLWNRYKYKRLQEKFHKNNMALVREEFEKGFWYWDEHHGPINDWETIHAAAEHEPPPEA